MMQEATLKIVVVGQSGVGKTSLCKAFCGRPKNVGDGCGIVSGALVTKNTISFETHNVPVKYGGEEFDLVVYDLAGNITDLDFRSYAQQFVVKSDCLMLTYDTSDVDGYSRQLDHYMGQTGTGDVLRWAKDFKKPLVMAGTKFDLIAGDQKKVAKNTLTLNRFSKDLSAAEGGSGFDYMSITSAKMDLNVKGVFEKAIALCIEHQIKQKMCLCERCVYIYDAFVNHENALPFFRYKRWVKSGKEDMPRVVAEKKGDRASRKKANRSPLSLPPPLVKTVDDDDGGDDGGSSSEPELDSIFDLFDWFLKCCPGFDSSSEDEADSGN